MLALVAIFFGGAHNVLLRPEFFGQDEASLRKTSEENFGFFGDMVVVSRRRRRTKLR